MAASTSSEQPGGDQQQDKQRIKYTVTHYRKSKHTHEEFISWFVKEHLPLALPILKKHGVIEYTLFVTPATLNSALAQEMEKARPTWKVADFDCFIEYTIPDMQVIGKVMADPEWQVAIRDEEEWVDTSRALLSVGYATPYLLETGDVVNMQKNSRMVFIPDIGQAEEKRQGCGTRYPSVGGI